MKILVTGGAGYIGSHTVVDLLNNGFQPISIDNFSKSYASVFDGIKAITGSEIINYAVDLCDKERTRRVFAENDDIAGVIHFAAYKSVPESVERPLDYYHNNLNSLLNILDLCQEFEVEHIVFSSSCSVYGNPDQLPVTENTPLKSAESPYAATKQMGEVILQDASARYAFKSLALRYFNPVGAHESALIGEHSPDRPNNLLPIITQTAAGIMDSMKVWGDDYDTRDGSCIRDYIHVMDIANAHTKALQYLMTDKNKPGFDIINLGSGEGLSVLEIIKSFEKISGQSLNYEIGPRRAGDVVAVYADNTKAKQLLNWEVKFNTDDMLRTAWHWQKTLLNK